MTALSNFARAINRPDHLGLETAFMEVMNEVYDSSFSFDARFQAETPEKEAFLAEQRCVYRQLFPAKTGMPDCPLCGGAGYYSRLHPLFDEARRYPCDCLSNTRCCTNCARPVINPRRYFGLSQTVHLCQECERELSS